MAAQSPTIAVIGGTGAEGSAIALRLGQAGYRVTIGTRDSAKGTRVTAELNDLLGSEAISFACNAIAATCGRDRDSDGALRCSRSNRGEYTCRPRRQDSD